jgi:hypothetical protein
MDRLSKNSSLYGNTTDSLSVSPKKNELPTKNPNMIDAKVENLTFKKRREPAQASILSILL